MVPLVGNRWLQQQLGSYHAHRPPLCRRITGKAPSRGEYAGGAPECGTAVPAHHQTPACWWVMTAAAAGRRGPPGNAGPPSGNQMRRPQRSRCAGRRGSRLLTTETSQPPQSGGLPVRSKIPCALPAGSRSCLEAGIEQSYAAVHIGDRTPCTPLHRWAQVAGMCWQTLQRLFAAEVGDRQRAVSVTA